MCDRKFLLRCALFLSAALVSGVLGTTFAYYAVRAVVGTSIFNGPFQLHLVDWIGLFLFLLIAACGMGWVERKSRLSAGKDNPDRGLKNGGGALGKRLS